MGSYNDIAAISRIVHRHGARLLVDAAQLAAHRPVRMAADDIDLLRLFSEDLIPDKAARQEELNKLVNVIAEQTTKVINDTVAANVSIPAGAGPFVKYTVESGDSLNTIAKAHKVKIDEIRKANRMKNDSIRAGQVLYIPKKD